jgi:hypothetical protein
MSNLNVPSLTKVLHACFSNPPSGLDSLTMSKIISKPYQTLMSELSCQPGHKFGADLVIPLCRVMDTSEPVAFLARQLGGAFVRLPDAEANSCGLAQNMANAVCEFGEFVSACARSLSSDSLSAADAARISKEGHEAVEAIMSLFKSALRETRS